jgi:hypothetical protein
MASPLQPSQVIFDDDAPQTVDEYSEDVVAFLMWAARAAPRGTQTHRPSGDDISDQIHGSLVFDEAEVSAVPDPRG